VIDHRTDRERDLVHAAQWSFMAPDAGLNVSSFLFGCVEQIAPLARALVGKQRVGQATRRSPG